MNRTARKLKGEQTRKLKRIILNVGGLLFLGVAAFIFFQNNDFGGGTPKLTVDQQSIDFGDVKNYTKKSFTITVTNTGDGILRFSEDPVVQVVDGCCPPKLTIGSKVLKPGESTTITSAEFSMHPGMDGKHNYAVHLKTNDPAQQDLVVTVLSNWLE
jgi:hypothetical protein